MVSFSRTTHPQTYKVRATLLKERNNQHEAHQYG